MISIISIDGLKGSVMRGAVNIEVIRRQNILCQKTERWCTNSVKKTISFDDGVMLMVRARPISNSPRGII